MSTPLAGILPELQKLGTAFEGGHHAGPGT